MDFFDDPTHLGFWMLVGVIVCGAFLLRNYRRFVNERSWLDQLQSHLTQHRDNLHEFWQEFWPTLSSGSIIPLKSLAFQRVDVVRFLEHSGVHADASTLSDIDGAREESRRASAVPNYLVSIFLLVGLAGTFLALKELLHNSPLKNVTSSGQIDSKQLQFAIDQIYQGFGGAFFASITGIAATIVMLALRLVLVMPERDKFFSELDHLTQTQLIPLFRRRDEDRTPYAYAYHTSRNLAEAAERATQVTEDLRKHSASAGITAEGLKSIVVKVNNSIRALDGLFGANSGLQRTFDELVKLSTSADKRHEALTTQINEVVGRSERQAEEFRDLSASGQAQTERVLTVQQQSLVVGQKAEEQFKSLLSEQNAQLDKMLRKNAESTAQSASALLTAIKSIPKATPVTEVSRAVSASVGPLPRRTDELTTDNKTPNSFSERPVPSRGVQVDSTSVRNPQTQPPKRITLKVDAEPAPRSNLSEPPVRNSPSSLSSREPATSEPVGQKSPPRGFRRYLKNWRRLFE